MSFAGWLAQARPPTPLSGAFPPEPWSPTLPNSSLASGRTVASVNPLKQRTTRVYDGVNRMTASVNALGQRGTTVYDAASQAVARIDPLLRRGTSVYDRGWARVCAQTET